MAYPARPSKSSRRILSRLVRNTRGATAVEYGLIAAVIVITMIASFREVASSTIGMWDNVNSKVTKAR